MQDLRHWTAGDWFLLPHVTIEQLCILALELAPLVVEMSSE